MVARLTVLMATVAGAVVTVATTWVPTRPTNNSTRC